ncbi:hypothetical protein AAFF_G00187340 [Aldrovandia affinis]|uniref:Uncharacterized protein n=1 Tax=Aldrovandia affinis TaxID=143900 RepID=A0AAD7SXU6_9TELE|nr:hypothetical protein AAFF_G00187340 [Aldrovandia affinis]
MEIRVSPSPSDDRSRPESPRLQSAVSARAAYGDDYKRYRPFLPVWGEVDRGGEVAEEARGHILCVVCAEGAAESEVLRLFHVRAVTSGSPPLPSLRAMLPSTTPEQNGAAWTGARSVQINGDPEQTRTVVGELVSRSQLTVRFTAGPE